MQHRETKREYTKMHMILRDLKIKIRIPTISFNWGFSMKEQREKGKRKIFKIILRALQNL